MEFRKNPKVLEGEGKLCDRKTLPVDCGEVTLVEKETSAALCSKSRFCEARSPKRGVSHKL